MYQRNKFTYKNLDFIVRDETSDSFVVKEVLGGAYRKLNIQPNDICLDLGLNIGVFSVMASKKCKFVYGFEPDKENFEIASKNLQLNNCTNTKVFEKAVVGNDDDMRTFSINVKRNKGAHSLIAKKGRDSVFVKCANINNLIQQYKPTIMKIDTEGGEYEIIKSINDYSCFREIIFEFHHAHLNDIPTKNKYFEIVNFLKGKFKNVDYRPETKGAWVTNIYCFNE
tara:strand:- start:462 stop:1136 length:675 start_codon:yes stop_codon:yes gene_type:complete